MVADLEGRDLDGLRRQWRAHLGGEAPAHLPRWLLMRVLAYRLQSDAFGDLDKSIRRNAIVREAQAMVNKALGSYPFRHAVGEWPLFSAERSSTAFSAQDDIDGVVDLAGHRDGDDRRSSAIAAVGMLTAVSRTKPVIGASDWRS